GRRDESGDIEIALCRGRGADADGLIGKTHVQRLAIRLRMHGDGLDAHLLAGPDDPAGDLATVRYQNFAYLTHTKLNRRDAETQRRKNQKGAWPCPCIPLR